MTSIDSVFSRKLLQIVEADVRKHFPKINLRTSISGVGPSLGQYFIQIEALEGRPAQDEYFSASSKTEAKAKAWQLYLRRHVPGYAGKDQ